LSSVPHHVPSQARASLNAKGRIGRTLKEGCGLFVDPEITEWTTEFDVDYWLTEKARIDRRMRLRRRKLLGLRILKRFRSVLRFLFWPLLARQPTTQDRRLPRGETHLARNSEVPVMLIESGAPLRISCTYGALWLTVENRTGDWVLCAGEAFVLDANFRAVVTGLPAGVVRVVEERGGNAAG
jgi:hypothetical protein